MSCSWTSGRNVLGSVGTWGVNVVLWSLSWRMVPATVQLLGQGSGLQGGMLWRDLAPLFLQANSCFSLEDCLRRKVSGISEALPLWDCKCGYSERDITWDAKKDVRGFFFKSTFSGFAGLCKQKNQKCSTFKDAPFCDHYPYLHSLAHAYFERLIYSGIYVIESKKWSYLTKEKVLNATWSEFHILWKDNMGCANPWCSSPTTTIVCNEGWDFLRMMGRRNEKEWVLFWTLGLSVLHLVINSHGPS